MIIFTLAGSGTKISNGTISPASWSFSVVYKTSDSIQRKYVAKDILKPEEQVSTQQMQMVAYDRALEWLKAYYIDQNHGLAADKTIQVNAIGPFVKEVFGGIQKASKISWLNFEGAMDGTNEIILDYGNSLAGKMRELKWERGFPDGVYGSYQVDVAFIHSIMDKISWLIGNEYVLRYETLTIPKNYRGIDSEALLQMYEEDTGYQ